MRPKDHREQDGCHNCASVFAAYDYDEGPSRYCTFGDRGKRPLCGSVAMGENFFNVVEDGTWRSRSDKEGHRLMAGWDRWAKKREVMPWGTCSAWGRGSK